MNNIDTLKRDLSILHNTNKPIIIIIMCFTPQAAQAAGQVLLAIPLQIINVLEPTMNFDSGMHFGVSECVIADLFNHLHEEVTQHTLTRQSNG